jgi:hypothetical protein
MFASKNTSLQVRQVIVFREIMKMDILQWSCRGLGTELHTYIFCTNATQV